MSIGCADVGRAVLACLHDPIVHSRAVILAAAAPLARTAAAALAALPARLLLRGCGGGLGGGGCLSRERGRRARRHCLRGWCARAPQLRCHAPGPKPRETQASRRVPPCSRKTSRFGPAWACPGLWTVDCGLWITRNGRVPR